MPETCGCKLLEWTDKKPTEPGLYLFGDATWKGITLVTVRRDENKQLWADLLDAHFISQKNWYDGHWFGPLPELPRTEEAE